MRVKFMDGTSAEVTDFYGTRLIEQGRAALLLPEAAGKGTAAPGAGKPAGKPAKHKAGKRKAGG